MSTVKVIECKLSKSTVQLWYRFLNHSYNFLVFIEQKLSYTLWPQRQVAQRSTLLFVVPYNYALRVG